MLKWFNEKKAEVLKSEKPHTIIKCGVTPTYIKVLKENEVFVFGSNLQGIHGGGAARIARECFHSTLHSRYGIRLSL